MKKWLILGLLFLLVFSLTACGSDGSSTGGGRTPRTRIQVINFRPEDQEFYLWMISEFEKENPHIRVVYEAVDTSGYNAFLKARTQAGSVDIFGAQPAQINTAITYQDSYPLNELSFWDRIEDSARQEVRVATGEYLMAPLSYHVNVVFYNKNIFAEQGWETPTTWNEFVALLDAAKAAQSRGEILAPIVYGGLDVWPVAMINEAVAATTVSQDDPEYLLRVVNAYQEGSTGPERQFANNPHFVRFFERWRKVLQYVQPNATGLQYSRAPGIFGRGGYAMMIDGSWSLSQILEVQPDFEIGAFVFPGNDDPAKNLYAAGKGSAAFSIYKGSDKIEEAKLFIEFLYRPEVYSRYINTVIGQPVVKGITLENEIAKEIFRFDTVLVISNSWVERMPYDIIMKQDIGPRFVNNTLSVEEALRLIDQDIERQSNVWLQFAQKWRDKFFPES